MAQAELFQVVSGMYFNAELAVPLVVLQKPDVEDVVVGSKSVPPTATLYGVDAIPLTATPSIAAFGLAPDGSGSHPADPLSPDETATVIPSAAACCHSVL